MSSTTNYHQNWPSLYNIYILEFYDKKNIYRQRSRYPSLLETGTRSHSFDSTLSLRPHALN